MSQPAIRVTNLSKEYVVGLRASHDTLYDLLTSGLRAPLQALRAGRGAGLREPFWALRDVNFDVRRGEVIGIIGRNGAGKSTLLKILSRITAPTRGRVEVHGRLSSLLEVGTGFHPELSGRENIFLNGAILGMSRQEVARKFDQIVQFAEVEQFIETPVKRYSSGMYVRLAFSVAAHLDTDVMVVDEVLAVGDIGFQKRCLGSMQTLASSGRSIVFVSHNLHAVRQLCSRALVLDSGRMAASGSAEEAIRFYLDRAGEAATCLVYKPLDPEEQAGFGLRRVELEGPEANGRVSSDRLIRLRFWYSVAAPITYLRIGFDLKDSEGTILFRSFEDDVPSRCVPHEAGDYEAVAEVPANLLKKGRHIVDIRIGIHRVKWLAHIDSALIFDVDNPSGVNSHYDDVKPGLLNPALEWVRIPKKLQ